MITNPWDAIGWLLLVTLGPMLVIATVLYIFAVFHIILTAIRSPKESTKPKERHLRAVD
jgi:hypothetical protein